MEHRYWSNADAGATPLEYEQWARASARQNDRARDKETEIGGRGDTSLRHCGPEDCGPEPTDRRYAKSVPRYQSQAQDTSIPELIQHYA